MKKEREIVLELERLAKELEQCAGTAAGLQHVLLDTAVHFVQRAGMEVAQAVVLHQIEVEVGGDGVQKLP